MWKCGERKRENLLIYYNCLEIFVFFMVRGRSEMLHNHVFVMSLCTRKQADMQMQLLLFGENDLCQAARRT